MVKLSLLADVMAIFSDFMLLWGNCGLTTDVLHILVTVSQLGRLLPSASNENILMERSVRLISPDLVSRSMVQEAGPGTVDQIRVYSSLYSEV